LSSYEPGTATRKNEEAFIRDIALWAQNNNSKIVFAIFPAENQLTDQNRKPQEFIKSLGNKFDFPVIDILPYLIDANKKGKVYLPGDHQHLNEYGSQIVSNIIKEWLINQTNLTNVTNK
jgi:lysophospholipase L1-like esterase